MKEWLTKLKKKTHLYMQIVPKNQYKNTTL